MRTYGGEPQHPWSQKYPCIHCGATSNTSHVRSCCNAFLYDAEGYAIPAVEKTRPFQSKENDIPEMRNYKVIETRMVEVAANSAEDAVSIGAAAFNNGQNSDNGVKDGPSGVWGNTRTRVRTVHVSAEEIR